MSLIQVDLLRRKRAGEDTDEVESRHRRDHQRHRSGSAEYRLNVKRGATQR